MIKLSEFDSITIVPCIIYDLKKRKKYMYFPFCGEITYEDENEAQIKPYYADICFDVVKSSFLRWVNGYGSKLEHYLMYKNQKVICINYSKKESFPISQLKAKQKEEYINILKENWNVIVKPIFMKERESISSLKEEILNLFNPDLSINLQIDEKDSELLDDYPSFSSICRELTLDEACGGFISSLYQNPSFENILYVALSFLSKKSLTSIYPKIVKLMKDIDINSSLEKIEKVGICIYNLFCNTERNREIYFYSFIMEDDACELDNLIQVNENYSTVTNHLIKTFRCLPSVEVESKKIVYLENVKITFVDDVSNFYEGLICGPEIKSGDDIQSKHYQYKNKKLFENFFMHDMRCSNPSDAYIESEKLYERAMEEIFKRTYLGLNY
jgi:hypothetical protein